MFALAVAPLLGIAWSFLVPLFTGSMAGEVAAVAAAPDRFVMGTYCGVVFSFMMIPASLAFGRFLRPFSPKASDVATTLCVLGACFHGGVLVFQLAEAATISVVADQAQATTIVSRMFEQPVFMMMLVPFMAFYVGLATFALILLVRRAAPRWIPALLIVAIPIELAGPMLWKARAFFVMLAFAFGGLAWVVWRLGALGWARHADTTAPATSPDSMLSVATA